MEARGIKPTTLSLKLGPNKRLVKDLLEKSTDVNMSTLVRLAEALGVSPTSLLVDELDGVAAGPTLWLKGEVAAGQWVDAYEWPRDDWQAMIGRPDVTADLQHRFFLRVRGDSMDRVYPEGTLIECVSVFGRAEALPGRRVVVLRRRSDLLVEATVKEMVEIDGHVWFVPRSTNPAHQAFRADDADGNIEEVSIVAVVVSSLRPE